MAALPSQRRRVEGTYDYVTPASFPSLRAWWAADSLSLADGTPVGDGANDWGDSSGNGNALTQPTPTKRPLFKTNIFGSKPSIRFDGTDDFLGMTGSISLNASTEYTLLTVSKLANSGIGISTWFQDNGVQQFYRRNNGVSTYNTGGTPWNHSTAFTTPVENVVAASVRRSSSDYNTMTFRENKTARGTGGSANYQWQINRISNAVENWFFGDMAELLVWNFCLSDVDMDNLYENYLKPRWGLP